MVLWLLLLCLLPQFGCSRMVYKEKHGPEVEVAATIRPDIYLCRSPNMEHFNCWWHPIDNLTNAEQVTYVLIYTMDKNPQRECPDYVTAGPNSCHFDRSHTTVWNIYCMNVTAITAHRNYTSKQYCVDVADIVETEAPVNLTYELADAGGDEMGHSALLSWKYPTPADLQYGWITLVHQLQYRRVDEPDNWKVKYPLREPHVELLGLPIGDYVVRVRCRSHNSGLFSKWSSNMLMTIPDRPPTGKLLVRVLVSGVGVGALLVIAFGVIPQSKRIKDYFLPPIPKPRIIGIDSLLLKKGNLDEINSHLSNFHSYKPPNYSEEVWEQVNADNIYLTMQDCSAAASHSNTEKDALMAACDLTPVAKQHQFAAQSPSSYVQSVSPYCFSPPEAFTQPPLPPGVLPTWSRPEVVSLPGTEYSTIGHPDDAVVAANRPQQDFYTCVQQMNESGEVHLVPCLPPAYCRDFPPLQTQNLDTTEEKEEKKKLANYWKSVGEEAERSKAADPLLSVAIDNQS